MFPLGCIPLSLKRALVFLSFLFKNTLPQWGQALAFFPCCLGGDWSLKAVEIPNLIRVLKAFKNQIKALAWLFPKLHTCIHTKILTVLLGALEVFRDLTLGQHPLPIRNLNPEKVGGIEGTQEESPALVPSAVLPGAQWQRHRLVLCSGHLAWIMCSICLGNPAGSMRRGLETGSPASRDMLSDKSLWIPGSLCAFNSASHPTSLPLTTILSCLTTYLA